MKTGGWFPKTRCESQAYQIMSQEQWVPQVGFVLSFWTEGGRRKECKRRAIPGPGTAQKKGRNTPLSRILEGGSWKEVQIKLVRRWDGDNCGRQGTSVGETKKTEVEKKK